MSVERKEISVERLKQVLSFDPETGIFTWIYGQRAGCKAGYKLSQGHIAITVDGVPFYAHRLAWLYVNGKWPDEMIDHINGDRADNRFWNLRSCNRAINAQNQRKASKNNKCGFLGVHKFRDKFEAQIRDPIAKKIRSLGRFDTAQEAGAAYIRAKRNLHPGCTL